MLNFFNFVKIKIYIINKYKKKKIKHLMSSGKIVTRIVKKLIKHKLKFITCNVLEYLHKNTRY